jgi:hypothetical protein
MNAETASQSTLPQIAITFFNLPPQNAAKNDGANLQAELLCNFAAAMTVSLINR